MPEVVHTVWEYYDRPREGIADLDGRPHHYVAEWDDEQDEYADTYRLSPIDGETLALALEKWEIWRRWRDAFDRGRTDIDTHPALPSARERHDQLQEALHERLARPSRRVIRKRGEFRAHAGADITSGPAGSAWEVRWYDPS